LFSQTNISQDAAAYEIARRLVGWSNAQVHAQNHFACPPLAPSRRSPPLSPRSAIRKDQGHLSLLAEANLGFSQPYYDDSLQFDMDMNEEEPDFLMR
jgi:hypothetical protein